MDTDLKSQIKSILNRQRVVAAKVKILERESEDIAMTIKKHILRSWKDKSKLEVHIFSGGSWMEEFSLDVRIELEGWEIEGGKWVRNKYWLDAKLPDPPPIKTLKEFAERITKELGVLVKEDQYRRPSRTARKKELEKRGMKTFEDLNCCMDGDLECIKEGVVWYKGWEISDPFVIARHSNKNLIIGYSINGHGFGFDVLIDNPTKEEMETFLIHIEQDEDNLDIRQQLDFQTRI